MKTDLTMALITRLRLDSMPVDVDAKGDLVCEQVERSSLRDPRDLHFDRI